MYVFIFLWNLLIVLLMLACDVLVLMLPVLVILYVEGMPVEYFPFYVALAASWGALYGVYFCDGITYIFVRLMI